MAEWKMAVLFEKWRQEKAKAHLESAIWDMGAPQTPEQARDQVQMKRKLAEINFTIAEINFTIAQRANEEKNLALEKKDRAHARWMEEPDNKALKRAHDAAVREHDVAVEKFERAVLPPQQRAGQAGGTGTSLVAGFPKLAPIKFFHQSTPSIPGNEAAKGKEHTFGCIGSLSPGKLQYQSSELWVQAHRSRENTLEFASEQDVAAHVRQVLLDVIGATRLNQLELFLEVQVLSIRPDIYVVTLKGIPVGTVEVKKPGPRAMADPKVLGEVFDQLQHLNSCFGVRSFALLTTYNQWRVCWLLDDEDVNSLARAEEGEEHSDCIPTTPVKAGSPAEPDSPPDAFSPSKSLAAPYPTHPEEDEPPLEHTPVERNLAVSRVYDAQEDPAGVLHVLASVLTKMCHAKIVPPTLEGRLDRVVRVFNQEAFLWEQVHLPKGLVWDMCPAASTTRFLIWDDLGRGRDGRALLASSSGGCVCVLKFFFGERVVDTEYAMWHRAYADEQFTKIVRIVSVAGQRALLLPRFAPPRRTSAELAQIRDVLVNNFAKRGLVHDDVTWRNIGLLGDRAFIFDLATVAEGTTSGWVDSAVSNLELKLSHLDKR